MLLPEVRLRRRAAQGERDEISAARSRRFFTALFHRSSLPKTHTLSTRRILTDRESRPRNSSPDFKQTGLQDSDDLDDLRSRLQNRSSSH